MVINIKGCYNLNWKNIVIYYDIVNDNELTGLYGTRRITRLESAEGHLYFGEVAIYFSTVFFPRIARMFLNLVFNGGWVWYKWHDYYEKTPPGDV